MVLVLTEILSQPRYSILIGNDNAIITGLGKIVKKKSLSFAGGASSINILKKHPTGLCSESVFNLHSAFSVKIRKWYQRARTLPIVKIEPVIDHQLLLRHAICECLCPRLL